MFPDRFSPDAQNATVIKMWKLQGAQPLLRIDQNHKIPFTDAALHFDLLEGKIVSDGGDLKIKVNRPSGIISEQHPQDWSIEVGVIDGGLIQKSDKEWGATYFAPEEGYQQGRTFTKNTGVGAFDNTFFVRSRNGRVYSKLWLSFRINNKPDNLMSITLSGYANTNSSRNWEATAPQK